MHPHPHDRAEAVARRGRYGARVPDPLPPRRQRAALDPFERVLDRGAAAPIDPRIEEAWEPPPDPLFDDWETEAEHERASGAPARRGAPEPPAEVQAPIDLDALFAAPQRPRFRITAGAAVILALVVAAVVVLAVALQPRPAGGVPALADTTATLLEPVEIDPAPTPTAAAPALVHVLGQVRAPGVYEIGPEGRVVDAIGAAGGLTGEADTAAVNLARAVVDGEQIYVPAIGEAPPPAPPGPESPGGGAAAGGLVNVNTAGPAELETLPRIGPALAARIIQHREANGPFAAVDDLLDVAGIGESTLEGLRPLVTV